MPEISVIIPIYNAEKTIRRTVESIIYGLYKNIEVILVDDCSIDKSWDICKALQKEFNQVIILKNETNSGVSFSRNRGLDIALGRYIAFVDSDDWVSNNYLLNLYEMTNENIFCICGFEFVDKINNKSTQYLYDKSKVLSYINIDNIYKLLDKNLIQQLWNKLFRRDIIDKHDIKFDISQSVGEDFEFVLDYLEVLRPNRLLIINKPLYYYLRTGYGSLMNNFGLNKSDKIYKRYDRLFSFCNINDNYTKTIYLETIDRLNNNLLYQIVKKIKISKNDKIKLIEDIFKDGYAKKYYHKQKRILLKENIFLNFLFLLSEKERVITKFLGIKNKIIINKYKHKLKISGITVISQNCIGGVFYHDMGLKFVSPTINLFFIQPDFIKFIKNLEYYLTLDIEMFWGEKYPIGKLDDIFIYFMHYNTCKEARDSWNRRKKRVNLNKILILCTDRDGFNMSTYLEWKKIKYPKILFTNNKKYSKDSIYYSEYKNNSCISDIISNRKFYRNDVLINTINSLKKEEKNGIN